ncbi:MAG: LytTR family DNA-binding domain-containing protein [Bacteroidia bacterium]|jgi:DNA-binding LytR/AlgR family response regulator
MNCIVVDDSKIARAAIKPLIAQFEFLNLVQECETPVEAFNYLKKEPVDLIFLDVEMPGMTGLELIKNLEKPPIIILITSKKEYAAEAFDLNVVDYLIKPLSLPRFMVAVNKAKDLFEKKEPRQVVNDARSKDYIFVRSGGILIKIKIDSIQYVQAIGDYVNIYTTEKRYTVHITLKNIEEKLPADKFFRLHRSYLVALNHIDNIEENSAYTGKHPLPIAGQFKKDLLRRLNMI